MCCCPAVLPVPAAVVSLVFLGMPVIRVNAARVTAAMMGAQP